MALPILILLMVAYLMFEAGRFWEKVLQYREARRQLLRDEAARRERDPKETP